MKLLALSPLLIGLASAQSQFYRSIVRAIEQHVVITQDGFTADFKPYAFIEVENHGYRGHLDVSALGRPTVNSYSYSVFRDNSVARVAIEAKGQASNGVGFFVPKVHRNVDEYQYNFEVVANTDPSNLGIVQTSDYTCTWLPNSKLNEKVCRMQPASCDQCHISNRISLDVNAGVQKSKLNVRSLFKSEMKTSDHFTLFAPNDIINHGFAMEQEYSIQDVNKCNEWFGNNWFTHDPSTSCVMRLSHKHEYGPSMNLLVSHPEATVSASVALRPYALVAKVEVGNSEPHMIFIRGEDANSVTEHLSERNYRGLYYSRKNNWQNAIKTKEAQLVLLFPGLKTFNNVLLPKIKAKIQPFLTLYVRLAANPKNQLYLYYNFDKFLKTINSKEFDCSDIIIASRINSSLDILADEMNINNLNDALAHACQRANNVILDTIHDPSISQAMVAARSVVRDVAGTKGQTQYTKLYANLF